MHLLVAACLAAAPPEPPGVAEVRDTYAECTALKQSAKPLTWLEVWRVDKKGATADWVPETQHDGGKDVHSTVSIYCAAKVARFGVLEEGSPSGDGPLLTEYSYRPDGSLAFLFSTLRTFYGGVKEETRRYFDPSGQEIWTRGSLVDPETGKPTTKGFMQHPATLYSTPKKLLAFVESRR